MWKREKFNRSVSRDALIQEAKSLRSEGGENKEYDRALAELIYWTVGGESLEEDRVTLERAGRVRNALRIILDVGRGPHGCAGYRDGERAPYFQHDRLQPIITAPTWDRRSPVAGTP